MMEASPRFSDATKMFVQRCIHASCGAEFGIAERIYLCKKCGGPLEIATFLPSASEASELKTRWRERVGSLDPRDRSGVWRFRELLPFDDAASVITLGEGSTPLYDAPRCAQYSGLNALSLKHQGCNPTGSFKDTGMTTCVTQALHLGARTVVCASTGNTAASLAAYAARAGLQCAILLPRGQITASKLAQSMDYGAMVCEIDGDFDDCMRLIQEITEDPTIYLANSINPFRIEGQKTVAYELMEQCGWQPPDHVVVPGGNMGNSSALGKGFEELHQMGLLHRLPRLSVVQAEGSAPLARLFAELKLESESEGSAIPEELVPVKNPQTFATAIKIGSPVSWKKALRSVIRSRGQIISVSEQEIADAKAMIGRDGIGCEPASATTVAGIRKLVAARVIAHTESVVAVLTGHLLKDPDYTSQYHRGTLALGGRPGTANEASHPIRGSFANAPVQVAATTKAILSVLDRSKRKER
jgi:threonine synthase